MFSYRDALDTNMKLGYGQSVTIHSAILGSFLIQVPHVLYYNGRSTGEGISLEVLTKEPEPPERVSVS